MIIKNGLNCLFISALNAASHFTNQQQYPYQIFLLLSLSLLMSGGLLLVNCELHTENR